MDILKHCVGNLKTPDWITNKEFWQFEGKWHLQLQPFILFCGKLTLLVYLVLQSLFCIQVIHLGSVSHVGHVVYSVQVEKTLQILERIKVWERLCWKRKKKCTLKQETPCWHYLLNPALICSFSLSFSAFHPSLKGQSVILHLLGSFCLQLTRVN